MNDGLSKTGAPQSSSKKAAPGKAGGGKKLRKRRGGGLLNLLLLVGIIVVVALFVRAEMERRQASEELERAAQELEELRNASQASGQEVADQVLESLRKHIELPTDPAPTVATIVDVEALREANEFYQSAENGDHLVITERRAILYDSDRDLILDVVPVQLNQQSVEGEEGAPAEGGEQPVEGQPADGQQAPADGQVSPTPSPDNFNDGQEQESPPA